MASDTPYVWSLWMLSTSINPTGPVFGLCGLPMLIKNHNQSDWVPYLVSVDIMHHSQSDMARICLCGR